MPLFTFTVLPAEIAQLYEALSCLAKFDENITLEASKKELRISGLNSTKSAYVAFVFNAQDFFEKYHFSNPDPRAPAGSETHRPWACKLQNRALLAIFKRRTLQSKDRVHDTSPERCDFELETHTHQPECRLVLRLVCRQNVVKTYKLTYEPTGINHVTFDRPSSTNTWTIASRTLRDTVEYFGPKTDHVDWTIKDDQVIFTSYSDKIQIGHEIIRQPTHTSVTLGKADFEKVQIQQEQHISISVKDFRAVVTHADASKVEVTAAYSTGKRPMQITYNKDGVTAEYTFMTKGTSASVTTKSRQATPAAALSMRHSSQATNMVPNASVRQNTQTESPALSSFVAQGQGLGQDFNPASQFDANNQPPNRDTMPPPLIRPSNSNTQSFGTTRASRPVSAQNSFTSTVNPSRARLPPNASSDPSAMTQSYAQSQRQSQLNANPETSASMFLPDDDEDQQKWDMPRFDADDGDVMWDAGELETTGIGLRGEDRVGSGRRDVRPERFEVPPTQSLSQVRGLFD